MEREKDKNSRKVFKIVKEFTGKWISRTDVINDERGKRQQRGRTLKTDGLSTVQSYANVKKKINKVQMHLQETGKKF